MTNIPLDLSGDSYQDFEPLMPKDPFREIAEELVEFYSHMDLTDDFNKKGMADEIEARLVTAFEKGMWNERHANFVESLKQLRKVVL